MDGSSKLRARAVVQTDSVLALSARKVLCRSFLSPLLHQTQLPLHREFWVRPGSFLFAVSPFISRSFASFLSLLLYVTPSTSCILIAPSLWESLWPLALVLSLSFRTTTLSWIVFSEATLWRRAGTSPSKTHLPSSSTSPTRMETQKVGLESSAKETGSSTRLQSAWERVSMSPLAKHLPRSLSTVSRNQPANLNSLTNSFGRYGNLSQWCNYGQHAVSGRARWSGRYWSRQRTGLGIIHQFVGQTRAHPLDTSQASGFRRLVGTTVCQYHRRHWLDGVSKRPIHLIATAH